jgi:hypothetical protein
MLRTHIYIVIYNNTCIQEPCLLAFHPARKGVFEHVVTREALGVTPLKIWAFLLHNSRRHHQPCTGRRLCTRLL